MLRNLHLETGISNRYDCLYRAQSMRNCPSIQLCLFLNIYQKTLEDHLLAGTARRS